MSHLFDLIITPWSLYLLAAALLSGLLAICYGLLPLRRTGRRLPTAHEPKPRESYEVSEESDNSDDSNNSNSSNSSDNANDAALPSVTVVAYASSTTRDLDEFIESILSQDYPRKELVVVCDSGMEATSLVAERHAGREGLHVTFIPPGSQNLSRRKLALTLGMKAAKGDVVVTTASNAIVPGPEWLRALTAPFAAESGVDVVLGYSRISPDEMHGPAQYYREFDSLMTASQWIGYALSGRPYRGDGYNLAMRRHTFFDHKGYARTIYLHNGDDDLFVSEIADGGNTRTAIGEATTVTLTWGDHAARMWSYRKDSYDFTSRWLRRGPFLRAGLTSALQWCVLACCAAAGLLSLPSLVASIAAFLLLCVFFTVEILIYRRAASRLGATRLWMALPVFMLWHPIGNFLFRMRHRSDRIKNFTWQRHK